MEGASLIACTRCAVSKARCDRKVPCSQCVAKNYVCEPRCTSRRPRAPRKRAKVSTTTPAHNTRLETSHSAQMDQFCGYIIPDSQPHHSEILALTHSALHPGPLEFSGYEDFMGFSYAASSGSDPMDDNASGNLYTHIPSLEMQAIEPSFSPHMVGNGGLYKQHQQRFLHGPSQPPTPPFTSPQAMQSLPMSPLDGTITSKPNKPTRDVRVSSPEASRDVLSEMLDLLAQPDAWTGLPINKNDAITVLSQDYRDRIVAAVQILLYRALQTGCSPSSSDQGLFGRIVSLPPSHVLSHFFDLYAKRIESIQPFLGLAGSPTASIQDILQVDAADVGMLLVVLMITQGAMLTDHHESHVFAHGLIEVCRVALNHVLERRSISDPMVGGIALQLLTLCARSGKDSLNSFAMSKRGQYMSMLKETGILQPDQGYYYERTADAGNPWEKWKEFEQRNRHAYAWVYVDLETSLLHDVPPVLSIGDLQVPLPRDNALWHAQSYNAWVGHHSANEIQLGHEMPSLNGLFRSFLHGQLIVDDDTPLHHLRLLLHPLQAMVLEQKQLLRIFDTDEPSNMNRTPSRINVLGRLQETQDLVQDFAVLLNRQLHVASDDESKSQTRVTDCLSIIIMLHLVSLNVFTSIPDIERCAKEEPPVSLTARADMWRRVRYSEGTSYVLFHAGQIFRLIESLPIDRRPTWWPMAIYRASMACWSLRNIDQQSPSHQACGVSIDMLLPSDEQFLNRSTGTPVVTLSDGRHLPVLEQGNSLLYCMNKLESHPTHLVHSVLDKVRYFLDKWAW